MADGCTGSRGAIVKETVPAVLESVSAPAQIQDRHVVGKCVRHMQLVRLIPHVCLLGVQQQQHQQQQQQCLLQPH